MSRACDPGDPPRSEASPAPLAAAEAGDSGPLAVVVMGVQGCGKTSVGQALAERIGARFVDCLLYTSPSPRD